MSSPDGAYAPSMLRVRIVLLVIAAVLVAVAVVTGNSYWTIAGMCGIIVSAIIGFRHGDSRTISKDPDDYR
jgi:hypothetical protein